MTDLQPETAQKTAANLTGLSVDRIGVVRMQLDKLLTEGILIDIDISGESMFSRMAEWSEIGINDGEVRSNRMSRGQKYLIDEVRIKELRTVTTRMRQWLEKSTTDITGFKPFRYLYYKRYQNWVEKWAELSQQFQTVKANILDHYDSDIDDLRRDFVEIADRSWQSITALGYEAILYDDIPFTSKVEFSDHMVRKVLSKVPTRDQIEKGLKADYRVSVLQGREQIEAEVLKGEEARAEARLIHAKSDAKVQEEYLQTQILNQKLSQEIEAANFQVKMNNLAEREKRVQIEAMIKAESEHIRQQFAEQVSPIEEAFTQVRKACAEICVDAVESIQKNGHVRGRTAEKLRGLVEFYQLSSIQDDPKLLVKLQELKSVIGFVGSDRTRDMPERNSGEVIATLHQVIDLRDSIKSDLQESPSRVSMIF